MRNRVLMLLCLGNGLALIAFALVWLWSVWVASMGGPARITDLDRAGVIDAQKLAQFSPPLAQNLRSDLGLWVAENERTQACRNALVGLFVAAANFVVLLVLYWSRKKVPRPA